jgi:ubiquinone biosynthesis protein
MATPHRNSLQDRYREIASVLLRHGLGYLAARIGLDRFVPPHQPTAEPYTQPERVRLALEELGTTFIKLGQVLSTRPDLLPPEYQAELAKLQDRAPSVQLDAIREVLRTELGRPVEEAFSSFDAEPLAAASIGQAHAATLPDGTEVVVKVRRPGVVEQVEQDLGILQNLAATASERWELAEEYDLVGLAQEFAQTLRSELDYVREARNAERFAANFAQKPDVHIPRVDRTFSTSRVLTLERVRGIKIHDVVALDAEGIDRPRLAERFARIVLQMIFEDGFFHADPHPGNFFIESGGRIGLIDFGMVGTVSEHTREQFVDVIVAVTSQDADRLVDAFLQLGVARRRVERAELRRDLELLLSRYYGLALGEIALGSLIEDVLAIVRKHHLQLPTDLALLLRTAMMGEGLGAQLDPGFQLMNMLEPYAQQMLQREYSPAYWVHKLQQTSLDVARISTELPQQLRRFMVELEQGGIEVGMRPTGVEPLVEHSERMINRLVLGVLSAAFIVGLSVLMAVYHPPGWPEQWLNTIFTVGFIIAGVLGVYLAVTIARTRRF